MANQNETLRELLARARDQLRMSECCTKPDCRCTSANLYRDIGRALSEPLVDWRRAHGDALAELSKVTEERDRARGEVESLKRQLLRTRDACTLAILSAEQTATRLREELARIDALL